MLCWLGLPAAASAQLFKDPDWTTSVDGLSSDADQAFAVAVDSAGDVIVSGVIFELGTGPTFFVTKLDGTTGIEIWGESLGTGGALAVSVDPFDDVIAAGNEPGLAVDSDFLVIKLDGTDGTEIWRTSIDGADGLDDAAFAVTVEYNGNVVAAGFTTSLATGSDVFVVKLEAATGDLVWQGVVDGTASLGDQAVAVAMDGEDVVAAGRLNNTGTQSDLSVLKFVPEPSHALQLMTGLLGLGVLHRWRRWRERGPERSDTRNE